MCRRAVLLALTVAAVARSLTAQDWQPAAAPLRTRFAAEVSPTSPWPEHPRPLLKRTTWRSLNGLWEYAITAADAPMPERGDGQILVPFPLESSLSGVGRALTAEQCLWYRRPLVLPDGKADRWFVHFGAVDHACTVYLDGKQVGEHRGGFDPFAVEITDALRSRHPVLTVAVRDATDAGAQPRGKQVLRPEGIWYTACSGIWQTVWVEGVASTFVADLEVTGDRTSGAVRIRAVVDGPTDGLEWQVRVFDKATVAASASGPLGHDLELTIPQPRAWSPRDPFRYGLQVRTFAVDQDDTAGGDWVDSYFALRDIAVGNDADGTPRLLLNGAPLFQFGPLDQGYWPDGLFTPPSLAAVRADLDLVQQLGCNLLRKHAKVECERFYEECDRRGILVWQDMPAGDCQRDPAGFERELRAMIAARRRHPSIVQWVVFNEGWGQHDTERYVDLVRRLDPTRLVGNASGWTDRRCGDVVDAHVYPGPGMPSPEPGRAAVLGEFGGLGLPIADHTWQQRGNWGYVQFADREQLTAAYVERLAALRPLIAQGLCAAVYTQLTDVEGEVNGWCTYDRALLKLDAERAATAARALQHPPGRLRTLVATARDGGATAADRTWRYTTTAPAAGWQQPAFDDAAWDQGVAGFGTAETPGARVGTRWDGPAIWLRRTIEVPTGTLHDPFLVLHHDEDVEVWIDGERALARTGYTTDYGFAPLRPAARAQLTPGRHVLAVACRQTTGGQFVDVGLVDLEPGR